jgi:hypothetical protein
VTLAPGASYRLASRYAIQRDDAIEAWRRTKQQPASEHHWQQWLDWAARHGVAVPSDEAFQLARSRVWEASEFAALTAARSPETLAALIADGDLGRSLGPTVSRATAAALAEVADEAALHKALRLFRRRQMLRIVWRDLSGLGRSGRDPGGPERAGGLLYRAGPGAAAYLDRGRARRAAGCRRQRSRWSCSAWASSVRAS